MRILVTGGAGYLGTMVSRHLLMAGHRVTVYDNLLQGTVGLKSLLGFSKFQFLKGDVTGMMVPPGYDAIIHLAAIVGEYACRDAPRRAERVNIEGTRRVVESAGGAKVIMASTCSNYGITSDIANEDTPLEPLSLYAETKIAAEDIVQAAKGTVLRLATICGLSPQMRFDLLVNESAQLLAQSKPIEIYKPKAWRPFLHIRDAAVAMELALQTDASVYNVVGHNIRKEELIQIAHLTDREAVIEVSNSTKDPRDYRVSGQKFLDAAEFFPAYSIQDAFREVYNAVRMGVFS